MLQALSFLTGLLTAMMAFAVPPAETLKEETFYLYGQKFTVHRPQSSVGKTDEIPLLVLFHGCKMNSADILEVTEFKKIAAAKNFAILTPEQSSSLNYDNCWNWFSSGNQENSSFSELSMIKAGIDWAVSRYPIHLEKVYLAGFSAGAAISANLFYCYPDRFAGLAIHSGVAFKAADNLTEANDALTQGSKKSDKQLSKDAFACARPNAAHLKDKKMILFHGSKDKRVVSKNALQANQQFVGFWDLADDGKWNQSVPIVANNSQVGNADFPATNNHTTLGRFGWVELIQITNLDHRWSGGNLQNPYGQPDSLKASDYISKKFFPGKK